MHAFPLLHLDVHFEPPWLVWGTPHARRWKGIINPRPQDSIYTNYYSDVVVWCMSAYVYGDVVLYNTMLSVTTYPPRACLLMCIL